MFAVIFIFILSYEAVSLSYGKGKGALVSSIPFADVIISGIAVNYLLQPLQSLFLVKNSLCLQQKQEKNWILCARLKIMMEVLAHFKMLHDKNCYWHVFLMYRNKNNTISCNQ